MDFGNFLNYLKHLSEEDKVIVVEKKEMDTVLLGERVPQIVSGFSTMTVELLKMLTNDKKYYKDFYTELIEKNNSSIILQTRDEIGFKKDYDFNKFKIISALEWAKNNDKLNSDEIEKLKLLKMSVEFSNFIKKYESDTICYDIEGSYVSLPVREFIDVLNCDSKTINEIIAREEVNDISLDKFIYALDVFLDENKIMDKYYIPENVSTNLNKLREVVDITYINRCLENSYDYLRKVEINPGFREEVLKNMPESFDLLEKSFYIYHKMCQLLTYDEEQFAKRDDKDYEIKHHDFNRLKEIDSTNNKVVCYEFNALYAKLLKELGIKYQLEGKSEYAKGHAALIFRVDKFIVRADSTVGIIKSDLAYAKNGLLLTGFSLENDNDKTYDKFVEKLDNVYDYLIKNDDIKKFEGTIKNVHKINKDLVKHLDINSKASLFKKFVLNSDLPTIDKIPYQIKLRKELFSEDNKKEDRFIINFISVKENCEEERYSTGTILSYNNCDVYKNFDTNKYDSISTHGNIEHLSYDEIKYKLESGIFKGIKNDTRVIPGFTLDEMNGNFESKKMHK